MGSAAPIQAEQAQAVESRAPGNSASERDAERSPRHRLMHLLMLLGTFFWASNIIAGKFALRSMGAMALAQVRVTGAGVIFAIAFMLWPNRPRLHLTRRDWGYLAMTALFGITLNQIFFIGGIGKTSAAHAALIIALGPVMVLILSCGMRLEALTVLKSVGAAISFAGVVVLTTSKGQPGGAVTVWGDFIMLLGTAVFAYYTILLKKVAVRFDALSLNTIIFILGSAFMLPVSARDLLAVRWTALPGEAWWGIAFLVTCGSVLAYLIYAFALTELTATRVAAFNYLQPVIAAALGAWLLSESLTARVTVGGVFILGGVYLTEREGAESSAAAA
ncbi:MAG TPA: DMT family transporter [Terriglobia bacterium]|nr:DMT family transporter [Terriglobia bacterium]